MLLGRQGHLVPVWSSVALRGDLAVCLTLCVMPHTNYHCSVVSGDKEFLCGLHRASALSAVCRDRDRQEEQEAPCVYMETL